VPSDLRSDPPALLAVPDKFRGTASAGQVCGAIVRAAASHGWTAHHVPLSDGGEGFLDTFEELGGRRETTEVEGPLGRPVPATWLHAGSLAVIEMAQASGLVLAGGAEGNDVMRASTRGTGELIVAAARAVSASPGATVVVGLGGSATTDGGLGAVTAVQAARGLGGVSLIGACDVDIGFVEAAAEFAPQKGATEEQVAELGARLSALADGYRRDLGVDVRDVPGAGAAGGMGGAIVALGGRLRSGYQVVKELLDLDVVMGRTSLVVTGEGALDAMSFRGKVVGSVLADAESLGVPALVVVGRSTADGLRQAHQHAGHVVSLTDRFGEGRALTDTGACIEEAVGEYLDTHPGSRRS
jgi:glycerate 2-kinase